MSEIREKHVAVWEKLYSEGHKLSYPNDVFVTITHRLLSPKDRPKVLDYGFGSGENVLYLAKRGFQVSGVEVSASALKTTASRLEEAGLKADLRLLKDEKLPFEDASFDAAIPWQVLNYNTWESLARVVKELDRVLKPGGVFFAAINAPGDYQQTHAKPLGNSLYELTSSSQTGLVTLVPEKERLPEAFPGYPLKIGTFGYSWDGVDVRYWIVSYEKK